MKREIKFRGKSISTGQWVYGFFFKTDRGCFVGSYNDEIQVDENTVGQLALSKDYEHNPIGQDIFEGDVLKDWGSPDPYEITFKLFDDQQGYSMELDDTNTKMLGNVHDNPDLIVEK